MASCLSYFAKRFRDVYVYHCLSKLNYFTQYYQIILLSLGKTNSLTHWSNLIFYCYYHFQCSYKLYLNHPQDNFIFPLHFNLLKVLGSLWKCVESVADSLFITVTMVGALSRSTQPHYWKRIHSSYWQFYHRNG